MSTPKTCTAGYRSVINWIQAHLVGKEYWNLLRTNKERLNNNIPEILMPPELGPLDVLSPVHFWHDYKKCCFWGLWQLLNKSLKIASPCLTITINYPTNNESKFSMANLFLNKCWNHHILILTHTLQQNSKKFTFKLEIKFWSKYSTYSESHQLILQNSVDSHTSSEEEQSTRKQTDH